MTMRSTAIVAREPIEPSKAIWSMENVTISELGEDEVLVKMVASGLCHTDLLLTSVPSGSLGVMYPKIPGHEGAGIVEKVGKRVRSVVPGDPVLLSYSFCGACNQCQAAHPAYCEEFAQRNIVGLRGSISSDFKGEPLWSQFFGQSCFGRHAVANQACVINVKGLLQDSSDLRLFASLGCGFQTGLGAIKNIAFAGPSDVVLICGLGAVGMGALMTAKILGCKTIIIADRVKSRVLKARSLGATHAIHAKNSKSGILAKAVRQITPSGATVMIDTTGAPAILEQAVEATGIRGKIILVGVPPPGYKLRLNAIDHLNSGRAIFGCIEGDCVPSEALPLMIKWYRCGKFPLDQLIDYFAASDFSHAIAKFEAGESIKPVLVWNSRDILPFLGQ